MRILCKILYKKLRFMHAQRADERVNISFDTHGYIHIRAPGNFIL